MGKEVKEILVGTVLMLALASALAFSYGGPDIRAVGGYPLVATFNRVDGLVVDDEVRVGGIRVGAVERLSLDEWFRAVATLRIDSDLRVPTDTAAAIHTDGLFGTKFAVLDPGGEETLLEPGDRITFTQGSVLVDELLEMIIAEGRARRNQGAERGDASSGGGGG